jgi:hypothetical protein
MSPDAKYAAAVLVYLLLVVSMRHFCVMSLEALLQLTRPGATALLLGAVAFVYSRGLVYTALALSLVSAFFLKDLWTAWPRSDARRLYLDVARDEARFDPSTSLDLQWANGTAVPDAPNMLEAHGAPKMLVFPPGADTLESMCG